MSLNSKNTVYLVGIKNSLSNYVNSQATDESFSKSQYSFQKPSDALVPWKLRYFCKVNFSEIQNWCAFNLGMK